MEEIEKKAEGIFENQKAGLVAKLEIAMSGYRSWRSLLDIKSLYNSITGEELDDFDEVLDSADDVRETYERTLGIVKSMTFEDMAIFGGGEFKNPVDAVVEFPDPESWEDVFDQAIVYQTATVAGSGVEQIRARLLSEVGEAE